MEKKAFSTTVLASLTTGVMLGPPFSEVHAAAEFVMGHPIWTHEFAYKALWELMRAKVLEQHPGLDVDASEVNRDNYKEFGAKLVADLGETLEITQGDEVRGADPITTARNMLGPDKEIIAVQVESKGGRGRC